MGISGDSMGFNGDFPGDFIPDLDLESRKPSTWGIKPTISWDRPVSWKSSLKYDWDTTNQQYDLRLFKNGAATPSYCYCNWKMLIKHQSRV